MREKRVFVIIALLVLAFSYTASAAVIYGKVYDLGLDEVDDAIVEISTSPKQKQVAKNSTYSFSVDPGKYVLSAKQYSGDIAVSSADELIEVKGDGEYVIDLILFPTFAEEEELLNQTEFDIDEALVIEGPSYTTLVLILIAAIAFILIYRAKGKQLRKRKEELEKEAAEQEGDLKKVIEFIKKEGGRATQKDIRKHFPQSEAKISLILAELEDSGKIKKIKKGRGNIIILK